jgi:hypothetical protein
MWHHDFIKRCLLSNTPINDAISYGVSIEVATVQPGQAYWKVIGVHHLIGSENGFNHHLYADVLDERNERIIGAKLTVKNFNGSIGRMAIDKPLNEPGTNVPIWPNDRLTVWAGFGDGALPSDKVVGIHTMHPDEGDLNRVAHHSFYVVFKSSVAGGEVAPVEPPKEPTVDRLPLFLGELAALIEKYK